MELERRVRLSGTVGLIAVALWLIDWTVLVTGNPTAKTGLWYVGQVVSLLALIGTTVLTFGYGWIRAAGDGRFARITLGLWAGAWALITIGGIANLVTGTEDGGAVGIVFPIGGILGTLAGLVGGILIARKHVLAGWQRFTPLVFGVAYLVLGFAQGGDTRTTLASAAELIQYLLLLAVAVALLSAKPAARTGGDVPVVGAVRS